MQLEHQGRCPHIHESVYVAPNAVICGDVTIGEECRVLFRAVLVAEGGPVVIGSHCIIMEHAVLRGTPGHPTTLGSHVLVGPHSYLTGCTVEDDVFIATGATIFNGALVGRRAEVRIGGLVHLKTILPADAVVPIGWIAIGDPAEILPPEDHDRIWAIQEALDFLGRYSAWSERLPGRRSCRNSPVAMAGLGGGTRQTRFWMRDRRSGTRGVGQVAVPASDAAKYLVDCQVGRKADSGGGKE